MLKSPASDTYIIFGEAKIEDLSAQQQQVVAEQILRNKEQEAERHPATVQEVQDDDEEEEVDAEGIEEKVGAGLAAAGAVLAAGGAGLVGTCLFRVVGFVGGDAARVVGRWRGWW